MLGRLLARWSGRTWVLPAVIANQACLPSSPEQVGTTSSSIVEGKRAALCEWPSVGVLLPSGCSGALIHRRAFVTAAHCLFDAGGRLETPSSVTFGQSRDQPELEVSVSICFLGSQRKGDFAVCVLSDDATGVPIIPLMATCETEWLGPGETAVEVGFGDDSAIPEQSSGDKSWLEVTVVRARPDEPYIEVSSGTQAGEYYGDSGGPLFFKMPDSTWRLIGTDSGSPDIVAGSTAPRFSFYANAPSFLAWAEQMTKLDLTPCHDQDGWKPEGCSAIPASQPPVADSWANHCSAQPTVRPQPSCPNSSSVSGSGTEPFRGTGGGCNQGAGAPCAWSSVIALLALFALRRWVESASQT